MSERRLLLELSRTLLDKSDRHFAAGKEALSDGPLRAMMDAAVAVALQEVARAILEITRERDAQKGEG